MGVLDEGSFQGSESPSTPALAGKQTVVALNHKAGLAGGEFLRLLVKGVFLGRGILTQVPGRIGRKDDSAANRLDGFASVYKLKSVANAEAVPAAITSEPECHGRQARQKGQSGQSGKEHLCDAFQFGFILTRTASWISGKCSRRGEFAG